MLGMMLVTNRRPVGKKRAPPSTPQQKCVLLLLYTHSSVLQTCWIKHTYNWLETCTQNRTLKSALYWPAAFLCHTIYVDVQRL